VNQFALIADSHGSKDKVEKALELIAKQKISLVIHAGDGVVYGLKEILANFPQLEIKYALGNCDVNEEIIAELQELDHLEIGEVVTAKLERFQIAASHIEGIAQSKLKNQPIDLFCHGHTHRAKAVKRDNYTVLNPGALCEDGGLMLVRVPELRVQRINI
jgi:putative phosphoesterase